MTTTEIDLFRSVRSVAFPKGTVIDEKPAPGVLHPDFEPRQLPTGKIRGADVRVSGDKLWVHAGGGTSLFDRANVFKSRGWLCFTTPTGTEVPDSLKIRHTGHNSAFMAEHYQIEVAAERMRLDAYKGALENLARNAVVKSIEIAQRGQH